MLVDYLLVLTAEVSLAVMHSSSVAGNGQHKLLHLNRDLKFFPLLEVVLSLCVSFLGFINLLVEVGFYFFWPLYRPA